MHTGVGGGPARGGALHPPIVRVRRGRARRLLHAPCIRREFKYVFVYVLENLMMFPLKPPWRTVSGSLGRTRTQ